MQTKEWRQKLGETVREFFLSPEMKHFYSLKVTPERAKVYILQLGIYVRQRRHYWPQLAANCPEMEVKRRILSHEYEELVEDDYSDVGHLDLVFRQGRELGLSQEEILGAQALPTTKAAIYGWWWIARHRPWQEALAASTIAEWTNDDRLRDLGFGPKQMPNFVAHSQADEKHSDMFLDVLERYVPPSDEQKVLDTARESMEIHRAYFGGMATAMAYLPT
jgi:pyrroloquinoline quinone (PQQ) biosynthesis protein C